MNRFKQVIFTVLACLFVVSVYSCGPTDKPANKTASKKTKPPPHWADGVLDDFPISDSLSYALFCLHLYKKKYDLDEGAITLLHLGKFKDGEEYNSFTRELYDPYSVDIAVLSLKEMGFEEPTTMSSIVKRFQEHGYRPLTLREVANLRLHFKDQPRMQNAHKMSIFYTLPDKNTRHPLTSEWKYHFFLENNNYSGKALKEEIVYEWEQDTFDIVKRYPGNKTKLDVAFAAVKIGSEKAIEEKE